MRSNRGGALVEELMEECSLGNDHGGEIVEETHVGGIAEEEAPRSL